MEIWQLTYLGEEERSQRITSQKNLLEVLTEVNADGHQIYVIPEINSAESNRLGLIITRMDIQENVDTLGGYTIELHDNN